MKLRNLIFGTLVTAGSIHGSIVQSVTGLANPAFIQTFGSPALTAGTTSTTGTTVTNQFSNIILSNNGTGLFWDPNGNSGGNSCQSTLGVAIPNISANCVGNFLNTGGSSGVGVTQVANDPIGNPFSGGTLPSITIAFTSSTLNNVAFILATNANGAGPQFNNTNIAVYDTNNVLRDSSDVHSSLAGQNPIPNGNWYDINESFFIGKVVISSTGADETGQGGNPGSMTTPWAAILGNVEGSNTPEPASMALLGLGLAGIGFFARRRKA